MSEITRYLDFDLSIWSEGGRYMGKVTDSPVGASAKAELKSPFPDATRAELLLRLEIAVLRGQGLRRRGSREETVLRDFGSDLFKMVFRDAPAIATQFASSINAVGMRPGQGLRLKLRVEPPELAMLPWEYLYDDQAQSYLCLRYRSPLVRFLEIPERTPALAVEGPLNILGMIANPQSDYWEPLDTERERARIDEAIASLPERSAVNFRWVNGDTEDHLLDMMQQEPWHVFHFIGHGGADDDGQMDENGGDNNVPGDADHESEGYIVLADRHGGAKQISASKLGYLLQSDGSLRLAVLNCCDGARAPGQSPFSSAGAALVRSGVPVVVAMQYQITDEAAIQFASWFYKSLIAGYPVERAITVARVKMSMGSNVEWGIPVLFTRAETGAIFSIARRRTPLPLNEPNSRIRDRASDRNEAQEELRRLFPS